MKFYCSDCKLEFDDKKPLKKEYRDYILGPCWKYVSNCSECGMESNEKITPRPLKLSNSYPQNPCNGECGCRG